jgi:magnesium-dependent phosphatase 1
MLAALAATGLVPGPTFAAKVRAACAELGISDSGLTVPELLRACNAEMGIDVEGPLLEQADFLISQLGISVESAPPPSAAPPPPPPRREERPPAPKMVVFDLDFTLWKPELYQLSSGSPFKVSSDGCVITARGERLELFPAARTALCELADAGVPVAIASRAGEVAWAEEILRLMRVDKKRTMADVIGSAPVVIQGGSKTRHLKHIAAESGVPLREMLFFDNERTNIQEVSALGVTSIYCPRGLTREVYLEGVAEHLQKTAGGSQRKDDDEAAGRNKARKKERRMGGRGR